jgi:putative hemolysin
MSEAFIFILLLILSLLCQGFFTMSEMAFVSFNRVRLAYYVEKGEERAKSLRSFLERPTALFGTTLIGVNFFLQLGSECSRRIFYHFHLDPDYAYIPQVIIVLLFAELLPMLAARAHSEQIAMFAIRPISFFSKLLKPVISIIDALSKVVSYFLKSPMKINTSLSRDELKNLMMDSEGSPEQSEKEDLEPLIENIFHLKTKNPRDMMKPIQEVPSISYQSIVGDVRSVLSEAQSKYVLLFHKNKRNIVGIVYAQDLLNLPDSDSVKDASRSPWFVVESNSIFQVINQFRKNNQKIAVVLSSNGSVMGVLSLSSIIDEIFSGILLNTEISNRKVKVYVNKAFPLSTTLQELSDTLKLEIDDQKDLCLESLMEKKLGYPPKDKERAFFSGYELVFEGATFPQDRKIRVRSC